jgi:hypothetical protein
LNGLEGRAALVRTDVHAGEGVLLADLAGRAP